MTPALKTPAPGADVLDMRPDSRLARDERGFTLIELSVGILILVVGILGVMSMADFASKNTRENNSRVAATNLAREIAEGARSVDYDLLTPALVVSELQKRPGLAASGTPWTLERRRVTYTIGVSVCAYDDPRDGLAAPGNGPANPCPTNGAGPSNTPERNGDDFRRLDINLSWVRDGRPRQMTQTEMIVNPAGSLGPRILKFDDPVAQISSGSLVSLPVSTQDADAVRWSVESVDSGDASGGRREWTISWSLGSDPTAPGYVHDGVYMMSAQAFARGIAGDARFVTIPVNRNQPFPPTGFTGGRNQRWGGIVDLRWNHSIEADVRRYRVYRVDSSGTKALICDRLKSQRPTCTDTVTPIPGGNLRYYLVPMDAVDLASATSAERETSTPAVLDVGATPGPAPATPTDLQVSVVDGVPRFDWTQPDMANVAFWRVYRRQGTHPGAALLVDRYVTVGANHFEDPQPKSGPVTYWFSAVTADFNESPTTSAVIVNLP